MFRSIRPIYFLVYGQEALEIFKQLTFRVERDYPELAGLHYGTVFVKGAAGEASAADPFFDSDKRLFPVEPIDVDDLASARAASSRARKRLCNPRYALEAGAKGWEVSDGSPIFIMLVDNAAGGGPDWVELCQQIRSEWSKLENGLQQSFSILLGPRLKEGFDGIRTSEAFCGSAEAFLQLVRGGRHSGDTGEKEWLPQMVAVDGRLEAGGSVQPEDKEAQKDLRSNVVDLVYGMVGLTLTDQSVLGFFDKHLCRTAGLVRIGLPIQSLLSEHRCEWLGRYSKGLLGEENPDSEIQGQEEARKWLSESLLGKGEKILGENLKGKINYTTAEEEHAPIPGPEFIENLRGEIKKFWDSRVELVPGRVEANRKKLLEGFEDRLVAKIGNWLDEGRTPEEIANILKMIRGSRGGGLAGHTKGVDDLRSRKWDKVRSLEHLRPVVDPDRAAEYERLQKKLDLLLDEAMDSAGNAPAVEDDPEAAKAAEARKEKLQRRREVQLDALLPAGEKDETFRDRIGRVQGCLNATVGESVSEKKARKEVNALQKKGGALQRKLEKKLADLSRGDGPVTLEGDIQNIESELFRIESAVDELKGKWRFITLEGWSGTAKKKTLPSGRDRVVANSDDEKETRQELNRCRRDLENRRVDLEKEPENPIVDGEIERRRTLEDEITRLEGEQQFLKAGWEIARESLEEWQAGLESTAEHQSMVKRIRETLEDQVCISVGCAARFVRQIKKLTKHLRAKRNELKSYNEKSLLYGSFVTVGVALLTFLFKSYLPLLYKWLPGEIDDWYILIFPAGTAFILWLRWLLKTAEMRRQIAKLKNQIQGVEKKLARWSKETEFLFNSAANDRIAVEAMFHAIKAIDYSLEKVEKVQDGFEGFVQSLRQSLEDEQGRVDIQSELPKTRALHSVMNREQLNSLFLTPAVRTEDGRLLKKFRTAWARSRLWGNYYETRSLEEWKGDLYSAADDAHGSIREFDLEECLRNNPSLLEIGGDEFKYLGDSLQPLAELTGVERNDEQKRNFAVFRSEHEKFGSLGERLDQLWPSPDSWTPVETGERSEVSLMVLRPNIPARRIEFIQGGIQGLLEKPWREGSSALYALGAGLDAYFNISGYAELSARISGGEGRSVAEHLVSLLPNLICSDEWGHDKETGVFSYGELTLGRSITELLCRLAGVGLSSSEKESLKASLGKDSGPRLTDSFSVKMEPVNMLICSGDIRLADRELYNCWLDARDKALEKTDPDSPGSGSSGDSAPELGPEDDPVAGDGKAEDLE